MKLYDIIVESLKLMFASYDRDLELASIDTLKADSAFRDYIYNMPPAINRAFAIIENKSVLQEITQSYDATNTQRWVNVSVPEELESSDGVLGGYLARIDYRVLHHGVKVAFTDILGRNDEGVLLPSIVGGERYDVYYSPKIHRVSSTTSEDTNIPIPDSIASLIPYYVKSELYREEDASEADVARAWFTAGLNEIVNRDIAPTGVSTVFGGMI